VPAAKIRSNWRVFVADAPCAIIFLVIDDVTKAALQAHMNDFVFV
jgi:hypothetical protein